MKQENYNYVFSIIFEWRVGGLKLLIVVSVF